LSLAHLGVVGGTAAWDTARQTRLCAWQTRRGARLQRGSLRRRELVTTMVSGTSLFCSSTHI